MRLTILGGGGFRVPLVYGALLGDTHEQRVDELVLHDVDERRLGVIDHVLRQMAAGHPGAPRVSATTVLDEALDGTDFVFSAIRVGGLEGRTCDERVALDLGVLGQETTGPGGLAYGLRTLPVALDIARRVARLAPEAWFINFTNPAGMITQAMQTVLGDRVMGICDSPLGLGRRAAHALGLHLDATRFGYSGLNHLGWLQTLVADGRDHLPELLARPDLLLTTEEGRLFGPEWLQTIGAIPNEYLYYYYFTREAIAGIRGSAETRGEYLLRSQADFYRAVGDAPERAHDLWVQTRRARDETYMAEARSEGEERDAADVAGGGYEGVALALMAAIARNERASMLLNVRNGSAVPGLAADAVVEVPCVVDATGPQPLSAVPLTGHPLGLVQQVKAVETLTIRAAQEGSERLALEALALHPLVDSVTTARLLLTGYRERIPALDAVFR
ncbi:6-phospho-beta-glucosidase [Arsenicicoccus sp. oral taxon 190]|uniref:6-phospho-beta-glucosidase n=1 Tax=Arsenicicoccus sp. oral taxon 190 TaxID=1658671 RepID=UPI00067A02F8|nr:6-phospho-beta-glucosidase [Arsenicicoccus sp. oral taxon 190]AKT50892.1 6-phospho-beta-glucosidase [Arsenicicoccus sp. oral taxon 190]